MISVSVVLSMRMVDVSLMRKYVHLSMSMAPSIHIKGSSQFQPKYFAQRSASIAKTDVRASAMTWIYADSRLRSL